MANLAVMVTDTLAELLTKPYVDKRQIIEVVERVLYDDAKGKELPVRDAWKRLHESLVTNDFHSLILRYVGMDLFTDKVEQDENHKDKAPPRSNHLPSRLSTTPSC